MSQQPLVSVIIIFLNGERFLPEAIASVVAQTYGNWELLLLDDGSTDGATAIARRCAERFPRQVRYLEHPGHENRGMSATRNLGIRNASGQYLAFLDADDVWLANKLTEQVTLLEAYPEAALVSGRIEHWFSWTRQAEHQGCDRVRETPWAHPTLLTPPRLAVMHLRGSAEFPYPSGVLIRRETFDRCGLFEESFRTLYEDAVFFMKVCTTAPVLMAGNCWHRYRRHPQSACAVALRAGQDSHSGPTPLRDKYLRWVAQWLLHHGIDDAELWRALQSRLWQQDHPGLYRISQAVHRRIKRARHCLALGVG